MSGRRFIFECINMLLTNADNFERQHASKILQTIIVNRVEVMFGFVIVGL